MANQYVNKVSLSDGTDLIDLTADTVTASDMKAGVTAHDASGAIITGSMQNGSATTPATTITANPSISVDSNGLITATSSATQSVTPTISVGYVSSGTAGTITVSGSNTSQLTTLGATIYNTSSSDQTISSGKYITGMQTIKAVTTSGISAENIKYGETIKVGDANDDDRITAVTGAFSGSSTVSSGQTAATASEIISGYSAFVDGVEVQGTIIDGDNLGYGAHTNGIVGTAIVGTAVAHEYDADIFWDYDNWTGGINYGTYDGLARIIDDGDTPQINVTIQSEGDSYTDLALGIEYMYGSDDILLHAGPTYNNLFTWSSNDELVCLDPQE